MFQKSKRLLAFGPFHLDPTEKLLLRDGERVSLTPKSFDLLLALVERHGQLVEKEQLLKLVWSDSIVEETNLSHHISILRSALAEGKDAEPLIETVPKRGYRFVAAVREEAVREELEGVLPAGQSVPTRSDPVPIPVQTASRRPIWGTAACLIVLGVVLVVVWQSTRGDPSSSWPSARAVPLTSYPGMELYPTFSPDGSQVAFCWAKDGEEKFNIYVQQVGSANPLQLTSDPGKDWSPSWSPDNRWIAFLRFSASRPTALFLVPPLPGAERKVTDLSIGLGRRPLDGTYLTWSPDSRYIVVGDRPPADGPAGLFLVSVETGERKRLTSLPLNYQIDTAPAFSPDARTLAFVRVHRMGLSEILALPLSGDMLPTGLPVQLTSLGRASTSPVWNQDGQEIVFSSGGQTGRSLWSIRLPRAGEQPGNPQPVPVPTEDTFVLSLWSSRPGSGRLAYVRHSFDPNIWTLDLIDPARPAVPARPLISSTREDYNPQFSPDGRRIALQSMRSGDPEIWVWESDGSNPNQLTYFKGPATGTPRWSPDGRWIAFTSGSEGQADIYAIDADGGLPKRLTYDAANDISPSWSRDGKWIYFASNRSGQLQIWRMAVAPHLAARPVQTIQVTKNGGSASFESFDGKTLYYAKDWSLWSVPTEGGEELQILDSLHMQSFAVSRQGIFFVPRSKPTAPGRIRFFDFSTRRLSDVLALDKPAFIGLAVSHDGRRLLFSQVDREDSDLMLLDNFR